MALKSTGAESSWEDLLLTELASSEKCVQDLVGPIHDICRRMTDELEDFSSHFASFRQSVSYAPVMTSNDCPMAALLSLVVLVLKGTQ
jgi:hypothetical protein